MKAVAFPSIGISLLAIGTMGCASMQMKSGELSGNCESDMQGNNKCGVQGKIIWEPKPKDGGGGGGGGANMLANYIASALISSGTIADAALFALDTSGSSIPYPSTGVVLVKLSRSSDGTVIAAKSFPWTKSGTIIRFSDPNAVNDWAYAYGGDADTFSYDTGDFSSNFFGYQTMKITQKYEDVAEISDTTTVYGGTTCSKYSSPRLCSGDN